ncbi:MAG: endonuclease MutS2 [Clostridia bacterium]|nr:endonuclease MutS2 [Clostridia bacterium]
MPQLTRHHKALELDKILERLKEYTSCPDSGEEALRITPAPDLFTAEKLLRRTDDAHMLLAKFGGPAFGGLRNIDNALARAAAGGILTMRELLDISEVLRVIRGINEWHARQVSVETTLDDCFNGLVPNRFLEEKITSSILSDEEMSDNASSELASIRRKIRKASSSIRERLDKMIRSETYRKFLQEAIVTQRNGRFVVPVKSEYRSEIGGLVHDTSGSGATVFIEPAAVVEANNEIKVLESKERDEIERILAALSAETGMQGESIRASYRCAVELDLDFAKARFAYALNAACPSLNDEGITDLKRARHPLLNKDTVVPVDIYLGERFDTLVITGPNTGGKTVALKTVGLLSLMAACGLMIPASEGSRVCIYKDVFADIGDEQSIEQSLSTFSSHMVNIVDILKNAGDGSLVLIDELGAGTDPVEGAALAISVLETLRTQGCRVAATTHYAELKAYAVETPGVENGSCEFDVASLRPTYRLLIGVPGRSNAFAITERLGMDKAVVDKARALVSEDDTRFERVVDTLEEKRVETEKALQLAEEKLREARLAAEKAEQTREKAKKDAEREIENARGEARRIVEKTRREAAALNDEINALRKELAEKKNVGELAAEAKRIMRRKMSALDETADPVETPAVEDEDYVLPRPLKVGDTVRVIGMGGEAEVLSLPDAKGMVGVRAGFIKTRVKLSDLRLLEKKKKEESKTVFKSTGESRAFVKTSDRCDLRGMNADEALLALDRFMDAAVMAKLGEVTVIHGKGTGVLRAAVQKYLKGNRAVKSFRLGSFGEGEDGVTVVTMR